MLFAGHLRWLARCIGDLALLLKDNKSRNISSVAPSAKTSVGSLPREFPQPQPHPVSETSSDVSSLSAASGGIDTTTVPVRKDSLSVPLPRKDSMSSSKGSVSSLPNNPSALSLPQEPQAVATPPMTSRVKKEPTPETSPEAKDDPVRVPQVQAEDTKPTGTSSPVGSPQLPKKLVVKGPPPIPRRAPTTALTSQSSEKSVNEAPEAPPSQPPAVTPQVAMKPQQGMFGCLAVCQIVFINLECLFPQRMSLPQ